jgi:hypothetical protein
MTIISIKIKLSVIASGNQAWRDIISPQIKIKKTPRVMRKTSSMLIQRTIKCDSEFYFGGS